MDAGHRLTVVSAPAGFGKTTLLSDWLTDLDQRQRHTRVGWLSHDEGCGALTTYSTFGYEALRLTQDGARLLAALNALGSVITGLGAGYAGLLLGQALTH